ncbi:MAG: hypothetical protein P1U42_11125 [Phycisphaerales bacterium]|nr:hypothetical protein [Phycisphaerales bacterium]
MDPRFVTKEIHALLDYPVALLLIGAPLLLGLGESHSAGLWLGISTGVAALVLTIFTDHKLGIIRLLPYSFHVIVDAAVGITFIAAPFALGFSDIDAWFYWLNGAAVLTVVSLSKPSSNEMTQSIAA